MTPLRVKATIIEDNGAQTFKSKEGENIEYRSVLARVNGVILRLKTKPDVNLTPFVDKEVTLELELRAGNNLAAQIRCLGVAK